MILTGTVYLNGTEYYFSRIENPNRIGWYLYNKTVIADNTQQEFQISFESLCKFKHKDLIPFMVSAHETSVESTRFYGNPYLIESLLTSYNKLQGIQFEDVEDTRESTSDGVLINSTRTFNDIKYNTTTLLKDCYIDEDHTEIFSLVDPKNFKAELMSLNFEYKGTKLTTLNCSSTAFRSKVPDLKWEVFEFSGMSSREQRDMVLSTKQKSLTQLRIAHDLSWYFDKRGRSKKKYTIINTLEELEELATNVFPKIKLWSVDIESTGLDMYLGEDPSNFDHTVCIMMSWEEDQAIFIPIDMEYMQNIPEGWIEIIKPWLENIPAVGHNIGFDARGFFVDTGIEINVKHDTQILNFNINCHRAKFNNGLKYLEHKYFSVDTLELKDIFGSKKLAGLFKIGRAHV